MNRTMTMISTLSVLGALAGCGAATPDRAHTPQHLWTDADWYADALDEAVRSYEAEVELAASLRYDGPAEAEAVARNHGRARFDANLARALHRRGLTRHGLGVYGARHPGFVEAQRARIAPRVAAIGRTAATIASRVDPDLRPLAAFDGEDEADLRVADRR